MKQLILTTLMILAVCALLGRLTVDKSPASSPFSIAGVKLGMTRAQVLEKLGPPDEDYDPTWGYVSEQLEPFLKRISL